MSDRAQFEIMRFQILSFALSEIGQTKISDAYLYAWYNRISPALDDGADEKEPFEDHFEISADEVNELLKYLDDAWDSQKVPTFYEIEDYYKIRNGGSNWDRSKLIRVCRYIYLSDSFNDSFGEDFWAQLLKPTEHPSEAAAITRKMDRARDIYFT